SFSRDWSSDVCSSDLIECVWPANSKVWKSHHRACARLADKTDHAESECPDDSDVPVIDAVCRYAVSARIWPIRYHVPAGQSPFRYLVHPRSLAWYRRVGLFAFLVV